MYIEPDAMCPACDWPERMHRHGQCPTRAVAVKVADDFLRICIKMAMLILLLIVGILLGVWIPIGVKVWGAIHHCEAVGNIEICQTHDKEKSNATNLERHP